MKNYYEILGVSQTSDEETITAAFKALMQKLDSGAHSATAGKDNTKDFNDVYAVLKAYEVLIDPDARREYDASLAKAKPQDVPPPTPKIPVVVEEEEVFVFPSANAFTEQQPSRWNTKIWLLPLLLLGFFLIYQIKQSKNSADPNEIVTVTVTGTANVRDAASSSGTSVLGEYPPGTTLRGRWVPGNLDPSERWLELEEGGRFVWGRNLLEVAAPAAEVSTPNGGMPNNAMAYAGKYPSERIDGYGIFDAPDLQAAVKGMPEGNQIWAQITSESRVLDVESPNRVSDGGQSIVIQKCEAHNCGGPSSRQLVLKYFPPSNGLTGQAAVCLKNGASRQIYLSWGIGDLGAEMLGNECTEESFDYVD